MDPVTASILAKGAIGVGQLIGGSAGIFGTKRPKYEIPEALRQSVSLARLRYADPMSPGYSEAEANVDLATANQIRAAQESGNPQESLGAITGAQNEAYRDLAQMNEESQYRDEVMLSQELGKMAEAENLQFQLNELAPFQDAFRESRDVFGAGIENLTGALDEYGIVGNEPFEGEPDFLSQMPGRSSYKKKLYGMTGGPTDYMAAFLASKGLAKGFKGF